MGYMQNIKYRENVGGISMREVWEIREALDVWEVLKYRR